jgi:FAD synthetase
VNGALRDQVLVLASGVFDLVHYGHIRFIEEAKKLGGENSRLVVIVARDKTVERLKGRRPIIPEDQRRAVVESLKPVDEAILGYEDLSFEETIAKIKPDIIAVGYDQRSIENDVRAFIKARGLTIEVVRVGKFGRADLDSSSKIKRKILSEETSSSTSSS